MDNDFVYRVLLELFNVKIGRSLIGKTQVKKRCSSLKINPKIST